MPKPGVGFPYGVAVSCKLKRLIGVGFINQPYWSAGPCLTMRMNWTTDSRFFCEVVLPVTLFQIGGRRAGKVGVKSGRCWCSVLVFYVSHLAAASYARR